MYSSQQKRSLRGLLAKISPYEIQRDCLELLALLPLFETSAGSGGRDAHFVSANKVNAVKIPEVNPSSMFSRQSWL